MQTAAYSSQSWKIMGTESDTEHVQQKRYEAIADFPEILPSP